MEICVNEFAMTPKRFIAGTKGSYGFCTLDFKFSDEWNGLAKKVTFYPRDDSGAVYLLLTGDEVKIPQEIMRCEGVNRYVVSGWRDGEVLISITGEIDVLNSLSPDGEPAEEPTPSQMEQVLSMMQTAVETAESVREDADNGVFNGEAGAPGESAYEIALAHGFEGSKEQWLISSFGIVQSTGDGEAQVMSQKASSDSFAGALKGTASGAGVVRLDDVSPIEHEMGVKVSSKNFINIDNALSAALTKEEDIYTLKRLSTSYISAPLYPDIPANTTVTWSADLIEFTGTSSTWIRLVTNYVDGTRSYSGIKNGEKSVTFTTKDRVASMSIYTENTNPTDSYTKFKNLQFEIGTTATAYTPYIADLTDIDVKKYGKNLYPYESALTQTGSANPQNQIDILPGNTYTASATLTEDAEDSTGRLRIFYTLGEESASVNGNYVSKGERAQVTASIPVGAVNIRILFQKNSQTGSLTWSDIQLEVGENATDYEPYIEPVIYIPNADGTVDGVASLAPTTTLLTDTEGVLIEAEYNKDINKVVEGLVNAIISLGGNV